MKTCNSCGMQYPEGTTPDGAQILSDLRKSEEKCAKLRKALIGIVGTETVQEWRMMGDIIRALPGGQEDIAVLHAIQILIETEEP